MKKNIFKFVFDIGMALLFILLYPVELTGLKFHEIFGIVLGLPIVIHVLLNWKWVNSVTRKLFSQENARKDKIILCIKPIAATEYAGRGNQRLFYIARSVSASPVCFHLSPLSCYSYFTIDGVYVDSVEDTLCYYSKAKSSG